MYVPEKSRLQTSVFPVSFKLMILFAVREQLL